jgi:hypothetical protein
MWGGKKRWAAALILGAALAQPAQALPGAARNEPTAAGLGRLWEVAAGWLSAGWLTLADELASDHGPAIDPNGATANSDHGPLIDPDGATADSDHGSQIDPDG